MLGIGGVFSLLALISGVAASAFFLMGLKKGGVFPRYAVYVRFAQFFFVSLSAALLLRAVFDNDFSLLYVSAYSDRTLPVLYKISVLWAGPEGAALTLSWFAVGAGILETFRIRGTYTKYRCSVNALLSAFSVILLAMAVYASPFAEMEFTPVNGGGMEPFLQNIPAFIYPLSSALAFSGALVLFAHASAALALNDRSTYWARTSFVWIHISLIFTIVTAGAETFSAFLNLGRERFWSWDVMETASLVPLILLMGALHSFVIFVNKGRLKRICFLYPFLILEGVLFVNYAARSGVDCGRVFEYSRCGSYFLMIMALVGIFYAVLYIKNAKNLMTAKAVVTRPKETAINVFNAMVFISAFFLFIGSALEISGNFFSGVSFYINPVYYKIIVLSYVALCIALMGILSLALISKRGGGRTVKAISCVMGILFGGVCAAAFLFRREPAAAIVWSLAAFSASAMTVYIIRNRWRQSPLPSGIIKKPGLLSRTAAHLGFLLICAGAVGTSAYYDETIVKIREGENFAFRDYNFMVKEVKSLYKDNYVYTSAPLFAEKSGEKLGIMTPEIRNYNNSNKLIANIASRAGPLEAVSAAFVSYDFESGEIGLVIMVYPFATLMPLGAAAAILGLIFSARQKRTPDEP